ncbi:MAG: ROK family protein, partial [Erysipelotrichaceae bacterium]|nr:ROK family protein [Erysipelotrichaceae bacterium]
MTKYLGIDIGGTNIKYGIVDHRGNLEQSYTIASVQDDLECMLDKLKQIIEQNKMVDGIGISIPGACDSKNNKIIEAGACVALTNVDIISLLKKYTNVKIAIENDANCAMLAEKWIGNAQNYKNVVCVSVGTGIGGAIVIDDDLYVGHQFYAGEFGFMKDSDGNTMSYLASSSALVRMVESKTTHRNINAKDIFRLMEQNDQQVMAVYQQWINKLALGLYNIGACIDPDIILLGGGVSAQSRLIKDLKDTIAKIKDYDLTWELKA